MTPERLHAAPWDDKKSAKKKKRRKKVKPKAPPSEIRVPGMDINPSMYQSELPNLEYENIVEVPEHLLNTVNAKTKKRTRDLSELMMSRILPSILGLEAAQTYVTSAMRDGLGVEIEMDGAIFEATKNLANLDIMYYFLRRSAMPTSFKKQFLSVAVDEMARSAVAKINTVDESEKKKKQFAELQSVITRGMSSSQRREDKNRRGESEDDSPFGIMDDVDTKPKSSNIGAIRAGRRSVR